ncbi:MAG: FtsX-like permease family protein [Pseudomonadota bacterium]
MSVEDTDIAASVSEKPPIMPVSGWSTPLTTMVAAAMSFLAVLAVAASMSANRLAAEWRADLAGVATVRVSAVSDEVQDKISAVLEILRTTPGIAKVRILSDDEQGALLAPWLGADADLSGLPAPRLIDISLSGKGPDAEALQQRLDLTVKGAVYDDHAAWRAPLTSSAKALERLALGAAIVVLLTAGVMVAFAARATLAANDHVIATVRLMGAEDSFIAGAFVRGLASRAALGGVLGALLAAGALLALPRLEADVGLGETLSPDRLGWVILIVGIPVASAIVAWIAARTAVRMTLSRLP